MPLAVTHVLLTIVLVDLFRDYVMKNRKSFTLHTILIAGVAGLLPDIDMPLGWLLNPLGFNITHGSYTHTLLFGLIFLIPALISWKQKKHKIATYFFVIMFGILFHIFLDYVIGGGDINGLMLFWPFTAERFAFGLLLKSPEEVMAGIDAIILLAWLWHEEIKHKIRDFI